MYFFKSSLGRSSYSMSNRKGASATGWNQTEQQLQLWPQDLTYIRSYYIRFFALNLVPTKKLPKTFLLKAYFLKAISEIKEESDHLVGWVVVLFEIRVGQSVVDADPVVRVEGQHFVEKVESFRVRVREDLAPGDFGLERQRLQVTSCLKRHKHVSCTDTAGVFHLNSLSSCCCSSCNSSSISCCSYNSSSCCSLNWCVPAAIPSSRYCWCIRAGAAKTVLMLKVCSIRSSWASAK